MLPITLVRHPWRFYFMQFISFILISIIGCGIAHRAVLKINGDLLLHRSDYLALALGIVFVFLAFYMTIKYFKNTPAITANKSTITFGKGDMYALKDIEDIQFTGKVPFPILLLNFPFEGTCLLFKNGTKKYIYDDLYSNVWELKSFLQQAVVDMKEFEPPLQQVRINDSDITDIRFYKGNPILSISSIMLWTLIAIWSFAAYKIAQKDGPWIIMVIPAMFIFTALSSSMNYFGLSDNYFMVKNYHFLWKKHFYRIDSIKEVVFETYPKAPNCLRITTRDFRSKVYSASTLRNKHWLELMDKLREKGVLVRNECIPDNR